MQNTRILRPVVRVVLAAIFVGCSSSGATDAKQDTTAAPIVPGAPPAPPPMLLVSTDSVVANVIAGAGQSSQSIDVTAGSATPLTGLGITDVTFGASQVAGWLTATVSAPTPPAKVMVTINPSPLAAGSYDAVVRVGANHVGPRSVRVRLTVRPRPRLTLERTAVAFDGALDATIATQTMAIASIGGSIDSISVGKPDCGASATSWLSATLDSTRAPTTLRMSVSPGTLRAGTYACSVAVTTSQALVDSAMQTVTVTLALHAAPRIGVPGDTVVALAFRQFDAAPVSVPITNLGTGTLNGLSIGQITYDPAASGWMTASLDSATAPATLTMKASARALHAGAFYATVPIVSTAPEVVNSPTVVTMKFLVSPQPAGLIASPSSVSFTRHQGDPSAGPPTTIAILSTGDGIVGNIAPAGGAPSWLALSLGCAGTGFSAPCTVQLWTVPIPPLTAGTYSGTATLKSLATNLTVSVAVTMTVIP